MFFILYLLVITKKSYELLIYELEFIIIEG